jgi:hypothetical protein
MRKCLLLLIILAGIFWSHQAVMAQGITTANLSGVVRDATGSPIPGATVIATHTPSGTQYGAATSEEGRFSLPNVRIGGPYEVVVSFVGFQDKKETIQALSLGENKVLTFALSETETQLGEVVISGAKDPLLNADRTGAATNVGQEQIKALPTLNRSLSDYTRLTPQSGGANNQFGGRNNLYNNITVDGSLFNNAFGLSSTIGGQSNNNPISLDAIEEVQVNLAPYDVRQGGFTGAGLNAVTRAGTNQYQGSVYHFFRNQSMIGNRLANVELAALPNFSQKQTGFRVGGPIIKNKLFFFVNGEINRRNEPGTTFVAQRPGITGNNVSRVRASDLDRLKTALLGLGYDPGEYEGYDAITYGDNLTARIDWNISSKHKLAVRYNYMKSYRDIQPSSSGVRVGTRAPGLNALPFSGSWYRINNNMNSIVAELNSRFGNKFFNNLTVGWTALRDFRESTSGVFPLVDIEDGAGQTITSFGFETFSPNNKLDTDVFQIADNFTMFMGKHTITVGTSNEFYRFANGFMQNFYGAYTFNTVDDFLASAGTNGPSNALRYQLRFSALPGVAVPIVEWRAAQLGFYVQDEFNVTDKLKLTGGIRVDIPMFQSSVLQRNPTVEGLRFENQQSVAVDRFADTRLLWSPRIGFNWDALKSGKLQVRGGTGVFTGRIPFVWISNQASNNGVIFGTEEQFNPANRPFSTDVTRYVPANPAAAGTFDLAITSPEFRFPQVWRTNFAADYKFADGWVATMEFIYTRDLNAVFHRNVNLPTPTNNLVGVDNRPRYTVNRINNNIPTAILLDNTNRGYQYSITAQIQKTFSNGFFASFAYNLADARDITSSLSAIANTSWFTNPIVNNPNDPQLSYSNFMLRSRVVGSVSYNKTYAKYFGTTISAFIEGRQGDRYTYTYAGDLNNDGGTGNDLMYVPRSASEIILVPTAPVTGQQNDLRTADAMWRQLDNFINQDPYLSSRRGQYAERNGAIAPWYNRVDVRFLQDFYVKVGKQTNTLQLSVDIFNFLNMLNSNWGVERIPIRSQILQFRDIDPSGRPRFSFPFQDGATQTVQTNTFQNSASLFSRWQMQIGIRYIFN